jgi:hypothetical protein
MVVVLGCKVVAVTDDDDDGECNIRGSLVVLWTVSVCDPDGCSITV